MLRACLCVATVLALHEPAASQPPARDNPPPRTGTASVSGRVVDASTGRALPRVEVLAESGGAMPHSTLTEGDGRYHFIGLPAGAYVIIATRPNYIRAAWGETRPEGPGQRITLSEGQQIGDLNLAIKRGGVITGRIVDEVGDPLPEVQVSALRYQYIEGSRRLIHSGRGGQSNDLGEFRVYGLPPGQYYVSAASRDFRSAPDGGSGYAPTLYPGTGNVAEAQRLTVVPGQTIAGISLMLVPVRTAKVSGIVIDASGRPLDRPRISVSQRVGGAPIGGFSFSIHSDGTFSVPNLAPGDYTVRASGPEGESARADITVAGGDINGLQLVVAKPSAIRGRVVFTPSATDQPPPKPTAIDIGAWREWAFGEQVRVSGKVHDDATFEISLAAGRVHLRAGARGPAPAGAVPWRLNRVVVNDVDVADSGIDVPSNGAIENVVVEITDRMGELSGRVIVDNGGQVNDCMVIVFAKDAAHWSVQSRHVIVARPGPDAVYRARLLPGDYYVVAMKELEPGIWTNAEFLAAAREQATKLSIAAGEKTSIDLRLSPVPVL